MEEKDNIKFYNEAHLVPFDDRPPHGEGLIGEGILLKNPLIDELSKKMREEYEPKHKFAIFSLCTSTRPYLDSPKWRAFYNNFGHVADLVICSNGGIIPIEYQYCYPFKTYDAHGDSKYDELYKQKFKERLDKFLELHAHKWDKIILSFLPSSRNREVVKDYGQGNDKFYVVPSLEVYKRIQEDGSPGVNTMRFPQAASQHMDEISAILGVPRRKRKGLLK